MATFRDRLESAFDVDILPSMILPSSLELQNSVPANSIFHPLFLFNDIEFQIWTNQNIYIYIYIILRLESFVRKWYIWKLKR